MRKIREAIQETYEQQRSSANLTQAAIAAKLDVDRSTVSKRLAGEGNITLRTLSDLYYAMGRLPLENFNPIDRHDNVQRIELTSADALVSAFIRSMRSNSVQVVPMEPKQVMRNSPSGGFDRWALEHAPSQTAGALHEQT